MWKAILIFRRLSVRHACGMRHWQASSGESSIRVSTDDELKLSAGHRTPSSPLPRRFEVIMMLMIGFTVALLPCAYQAGTKSHTNESLRLGLSLASEEYRVSSQ